MAAPTVVRTGQRIQIAGTYMADCPKKGQKTFTRHFVAPTCSCCRKTVNWRLLFATQEPEPKPSSPATDQSLE